RGAVGVDALPPYGRPASIARSQPSRPASTAPVVATYSWTRPGRNDTPVAIQSIAWSGPATKPSSDIAKCHSTFPSAVCGAVSCTGTSSSDCDLQPVGATLDRLVVNCNQHREAELVQRGCGRGTRAFGVSDQRRGRGLWRQLEPARPAGRHVRQPALLQGTARRLRRGNRLQHPRRPAQAAG